jgi:hypothetical protein
LTWFWLDLPWVDQVTCQPVFLIASHRVDSHQISFKTWPTLRPKSLESRINPSFCLLLGYLVCMISLTSFDDLTWIYKFFGFLDFFLSINFFSWFHSYMFDFWGLIMIIFLFFFIMLSRGFFSSSLKCIDGVWVSFFYITKNSTRLALKREPPIEFISTYEQFRLVVVVIWNYRTGESRGCNVWAWLFMMGLVLFPCNIVPSQKS